VAEIIVVSATSERWADVLTVLGAGWGSACLCQYWRLSSSDFGSSTTETRRSLLANQLATSPAPGVLAYEDGEPAGWCGFAPRSDYERLVRSRTIPALDDVPAWSIVCFTVRVGYRRRGVARSLLGGAIEYARAAGAPALEAYPVDPEGTRLDVAFAYVGTTGMFEAAGFTRVMETAARSAGRPRWLMRLPLPSGEHRVPRGARRRRGPSAA
jgi:GNAT superfamily N-acetyltransferase